MLKAHVIHIHAATAAATYCHNCFLLHLRSNSTRLERIVELTLFGLLPRTHTHTRTLAIYIVNKILFELNQIALKLESEKSLRSLARRLAAASSTSRALEAALVVGHALARARATPHRTYGMNIFSPHLCLRARISPLVVIRRSHR